MGAAENRNGKGTLKKARTYNYETISNLSDIYNCDIIKV